MLEQRSRHLAPILLVLSAWFSGLACNSNAPQSAAVGNTASAENQTGVRRGAVVRWAEGPSLSAPLGLMANSVLDVGEGEPGAPLRRPIGGNTFPNFVEKNPDYGSQHLSPNMPPILVRFAGLGFGFPGFSPSGTPPDTNGDVGPNHYVHIVNSSFVVLDRTDGHVLAGPMRINVPFMGFSGANGACATTNQGDPLIIYDRHADRWIISQLTPARFASGPNYECVAVSRTGDPTLSSQWYRYAFGPYTVQNGINALNDYPKTGVWPDAYYTTYNMFTAQSGGFRGAKFVAWERAAMVAGFPAREIEFQTFSDPRGMDGYGGALPSDWDGRFFPPANAPNLIISDDNTPAGPHGMGPVVQIWKVHLDWINPDQSTITDIPENCPPAILSGPCPILVSVNNFKLPCDDTAGNCVPQADTTNRLDTLGDRLMYRLPYRNFPADHESILVSRSVDPGTNAPVAVRWYELQNPIGQTFADGQLLVQQGTHMPNDGKYRWMMSMAQDHVGNMAVGMSQSSPNIHPEIWIAGRKFDDPPNALPQDEVQMTQGTSSVTTPTRWGDYSMLVLDPVDDCTFWYTTEYMAAPQMSGFDYKTDVGNFKFDICQANEDNYRFEMPDSVEVNTATTFNITKRHSDGTIDDGYNGTADLRSTDPRVQGLPDSVTFTAGRVDNVPATFQTTGFRTVIATDHSALTIQGWGNTIITGGVATSIAVLNPLPALLRSGSQGSVTFVAHDSLGNIASGYNATVDVTYSDPDHTGPATLLFVNGIGELPNVTLITTGLQTITVRDPARPELTAVANTTVDPYKYFFSNVPASPTAGQSFSFHLQALDRMRRPATAYTNRDVRMTASSDPRATFPPTVTFTNGEADVSPATLFLAGGRTPITATDTRNAAVTSNTNAQADIGQANVSPSVQPAATTTFILRVGPTVDFPTVITNGSPVTAVCSARDAYNNITNFNGNVRFTSDDPNAELPPETTLVNGQRGGLMFTFHTDNVRRVTTTSVDNPPVQGITAGTYVHPDHFAFDPIAGTACTPTTVNATARLSNGTLDATYNQLSAMASSVDDPNATFEPNPVTFNAGQATFLARFTMSSGPSVTLTDSRGGVSSRSGPANITAGPAVAYRVTGLPSAVTAGDRSTLHVTAIDACNNLQPDYNGSADVTSSDPQAEFPSRIQFSNGQAMADVTLKTAGPDQTLTFSEVVNGTITGTAHTRVNPAAASALVMRGFPTAVTAGAQVIFNVDAFDPYGNAATGYAGTANVSSNDPQAVLPSSVSFSNGTAMVTVTLKTAGAGKTVTVRDAQNENLVVTGTTTVNPAAASGLVLNGLPAAVTAGMAVSLSVGARDPFGNTATEYAGTANVSSNDTQATAVPNPVHFTEGTTTVAMTFKTAGPSKTVTVQDAQTQSLSVTGTTTVNGGAATALVFIGVPAAVQTGITLTFSLSAKDAYGNPTTQATVHFTTDDPQAALPADQNFSGSGGTKSNLSATFFTGGNHTIIATQVGGGASATSSAINVTSSSTQPAQNLATSNSGCSATAGGSAGPFALMGLILAGWQLVQGMRASRRRS